MFGSIAPTYDALNTIFSLSIDSWWRRWTARQVVRPRDRALLDVACGSGALTAALRGVARREARVVGLDFCRELLDRAPRHLPRTGWLHGDGLNLPFRDGGFDVVTIAFGLRNMADVERGLREMRRVLRPGGRLGVLEFTTPVNPLVRFGYLLYFRHVLPAIGDMVSGTTAYRYLSKSVLAWPTPDELAATMRRCGFARVRYRHLSFGIAVLHLAEVDAPRKARP